MSDRHWRLWGLAIALAAWSGLILQFVRVTLRLGSMIDAAEWLLLFFTVISNLSVALIYSAIALGLVRFRHPLLIAGLALTMLLVGAVFEIMLRPHLDLHGIKLFNNFILHDLVPALCVIAWIRLAQKGLLRWRDPWIIAIFPITYLLYALVRGAIGGVYPYPFLDPVRIGWAAVLGAVGGISIAFLVIGHAMIALDHFLGRRR